MARRHTRSSMVQTGVKRPPTVKLGGVTLRTRVPGDVVSTAHTGIAQEIRNTKMSGTQTPRTKRDNSIGPKVSPHTFPPTPLIR